MEVREIKTFRDVFAAYKYRYKLIDNDDILYDICDLSAQAEPNVVLLCKCTLGDKAQKVAYTFDDWFKLNFKILLKGMPSEIQTIKHLRQQIDNIIQDVKQLESCRETSLAITKLQEAVMWLGMDLKRIGAPNPYPSSKDPSTGDVVEPTADNLKF